MESINEWAGNTVRLFFENAYFSFVVDCDLWTNEKELTQLIGVDPQKRQEENGFVELKYIKPYQDYLKVLIIKGFENSEGLLHILVIKGITYVVGDP
jgi:hypothetical protein